MGKKTGWIHAGDLMELQQEGSKVVKSGIAVFYHENQVFAVDNRCPHMGFPLHMGSLCDGILTCHWHHARFDICSGGTFDPWADDVPSYEVRIEDGEVWVSPNSKQTIDREKYKNRLREGLQQNIGIVIAKAVVGLVEAGEPVSEISQVGIEFGTRYGSGWNSGLTILVSMVRVLPKLDKAGQILALYNGLLHVARNSAGKGERHLLGALPSVEVSHDRLTEWYRSCIEVRDTQGAERILQTAIRKGASEEELAEMMLIAVTDHYFLDGGHTFDFHNKAFEALEYAGQDNKERVLTSLVPLLRDPTRSEELHHWQVPLNLVEPLGEAFLELNDIGTGAYTSMTEEEQEHILQQLLSDRPVETVRVMVESLNRGVSPAHLAQLVALAAAERIVRFHTQNDFGDWIAVLHTFTYAHAVHERVRLTASKEVVRAIFHGLISVYLDRFLNVPAAARPKAQEDVNTNQPDQLLDILDQRQQVNEAASWVMGYLKAKEGDPLALINTLGHSLLREDANFHSFQMYEAAIAEYELWVKRGDGFAVRASETMLLAVTRYLAAHSPTARELSHTARIAWRLHKGERLFEDN